MDLWLPPKPAIILPAREIAKPAIQRGNLFFVPPPFIRKATALVISNAFLATQCRTQRLVAELETARIELRRTLNTTQALCQTAHQRSPAR